MIQWFIRIVIYDICISRFVALFIFLGILLALGGVGYVLRNKMSSQADDF